MTDEAMAIVRDLAAMEDVGCHSHEESYCAFCTAGVDHDLPPGGLRDPSLHEPTCLWRRAKELMNG